MTTVKKTTITARELGQLMHAMRREIALMFPGPNTNVPPAWQDKACTEAMKVSSERGALAMLVRPKMTARQEHQRWYDERWAQGWRYGPVRDDKLKLHPSMRDFDELPLGEQLKDLARIAMVDELRNLIDLSGLVQDATEGNPEQEKADGTA